MFGLNFEVSLEYIHKLVSAVPGDSLFDYSLKHLETTNKVVNLLITNEPTHAYQLWGVLEKVMNQRNKSYIIHAHQADAAEDGSEGLYRLVEDLQNYNLDNISQILRGADVRGGDGHVLINTSDAEKLLTIINYLKQ